LRISLNGKRFELEACSRNADPAASFSLQAIQIFEVLRKIGPYHSFSAGLVIGGKNLKDEMDRLTRMNILIATPGRLLQHMDQTIGFECDNLQLLGSFPFPYSPALLLSVR
jgi:hypothetical protein